MAILATTAEVNRREAFAAALARGSSPPEAWTAAGFTCHPQRARRRALAPDILARVAELRRERAVVACDILPVIEALMDLATKAGNLGSAAGLREARGLLAEAGRLKRLQPPPPPVYEDLEPELTGAEWMEQFGAKDPPS